MADVAVVDYGMGNLRSVEQALRNVAPDAEIVVTDDPEVITSAKRVVFPGQGAMPECMRELDARGLRDAVLLAARSRPFLGICIGLQMLFEHSAEGDVAGLGILHGKVVRFDSNMHDALGNKLKVPHMGWNQVHHVQHPLWDGIEQDARFYFVHSYYVQPQDASLVQATSKYPQSFVCAVAKDNLFGVQFHPEKSHTAGLKLLQNFVQWNP
ncbi:MAG: imidazole glycerol phosphate synthase, glutamine amidotransferase subunit [Gallionellales bacterium RIFCSPLOWO2_02_FULL_57_47]|nr:MAG: imidazole glycerol phosphate synthase, glutamine amidotransferase subunit [Gallionellales bacterium RIFCSPLOWO2_02_FULL_57_47]OGT15590.1 MAG: imidazole glycerol phosphate synthase, glutamine amidotransferase subunit [Gallionellales bacterium RIFCSPHIGHO2_02_FULL_57_16]